MDGERPKCMGRYKVLGSLGRGTMGEVYLAWDELIGRKVAIKCLRIDPQLIHQNRDEAIKSFFHEARIVGNLNHNHITAVYDMGVQDDFPYIVMEYVNGRTIKEIIHEGVPYRLTEKLQLLAMMARAVHYAHQRGVLHRDIKPANIMIVTRSRLPKITDFSIARVIDMESFGMTGKNIEEANMLTGTPLYMSPEQIRGEELDRRADIFSLGVLAYEWLSGKKPFQGEDLNSRLQAVLKDEPPPLTGTAGVDEELNAIVMWALAKPPSSRFQTAEEFSDIIELYLNTLESRKVGKRPAFSFDQRKIIDQLRRRYVFFADFSEEELFELFALAGKESFAGGQTLIREGTSGTRMYIIIRGAVRIFTEKEGRRIELETLKDGSCVGEMSMIDRMPRSASVAALEDTVALSLNETVLRHTNPRLCMKLYRNLATTLSERLRSNEAKYLNLLMETGWERQQEPAS